MARGKSSKLAPFQKLLTVMNTGKEVTIEEIETLLGKEIYMYRLSTYMWHIKTNANGIVKVIKDGRKVKAYQIINVAEVKSYMDRVGISTTLASSGMKKPSISKLAKLIDISPIDPKPVKEVEPVKAVKQKTVKTPKVKPVKQKVEELEVTEVTEVNETTVA